MIFLKNGTLLFIFLYAGLLVNNSTCNSFAFGQRYANEIWPKILIFIERLHHQINLAKNHEICDILNRSEIDVPFQKLAMLKMKDNSNIMRSMDQINNELHKGMLQMNMPEGSRQCVNKLFLYRTMFEFFNAYIEAIGEFKKKKKSLFLYKIFCSTEVCNEQALLEKMKMMNTSNIQKIMTCASLLDEIAHNNQNTAASKYKHLEGQYIEGQFRVKIGDEGTGVDMQLKKLYNYTSDIFELHDNGGGVLSVQPGKSERIGKRFPLAINSQKGPNRFYMEDNGNWRVKFTHSYSFEDKYVYWYDHEHTGDYEVTLFNDAKGNIWLDFYVYHGVISDKFQLGFTQYNAPLN